MSFDAHLADQRSTTARFSRWTVWAVLLGAMVIAMQLMAMNTVLRQHVQDASARHAERAASAVAQRATNPVIAANAHSRTDTMLVAAQDAEEASVYRMR